MTKKKASSKKSTKAVMSGIQKTGTIIARGIAAIFSFLYELIMLFFKAFKAAWLGVASLMIAVALLVLAISGGFWLITNGLGLNESSIFQEERDRVISEASEEWQESQRERRQYQAAYRDKVEIAEITSESCTSNEECTTPSDYLIRSICPYESRCYEEQCVVVCPRPR